MLAAAGANADTPAPNILWIMLDDLRTDALSCYGETGKTPWANTPHLDSIASRGVRFERAYAQNVVCRSSRHSMLTGQYCHTLQDMEMGPEPSRAPPYYRALPQEQIDLPAALARLGMQPLNVGKTHWSDWWVNVAYAEPPHPHLVKFDPPSARVYDLVKLIAPQTYPPEDSRLSRVLWVIGGGNPLPYELTGAGAITDGALAKLEEIAAVDQPFFLRDSYHAPHIPILTPPEFMPPLDAIQLPTPTADGAEAAV